MMLMGLFTGSLTEMGLLLGQVTDIWEQYVVPFIEELLGLALNETLRSAVLIAAVTAVVVLTTLFFILQEGVAFTKSISSGITEPASQVRGRESARSMRKPDSGRGTRPMTDVAAGSGRPLREVEQSGVSVISRVRRDRDGHVLTVEVTNKSEQRIEMVVVDIDTPTGIESRTGSFRMQRLGTIRPGESEKAEFSLMISSGTPQDVTGYVEFMSASYEVRKLEIPVPESTGVR